MIAIGNHYGSRFAARKAGAAFRQMAKTSGNPTGFYGIMIGKGTAFAQSKGCDYGSRFAARKAGAAFRQMPKTSGNPTGFYGIMIAIDNHQGMRYGKDAGGYSLLRERSSHEEKKEPSGAPMSSFGTPLTPEAGWTF